MEKGFFHPSRGYWQTLSDPSADVRSAYPEGTVEVAVQPSPLHKMVNGEWVAPTQFDLDIAAANDVRTQRDILLARVVDPIASNVLRWAALSDAQRQALATYRQDLLDVPQQAGFPHNVSWPSKPE